MRKSIKISVLGGGLWGSVLAQHLCRPGRQVSLWEFFPDLAGLLKRTRRHPHIPGFRLNRAIKVTSDLRQVVADAEVLVFVLASNHVRQTAMRIKGGLRGSRPDIVNASKGVEPGTLMTMGEAIAASLPGSSERIYTLSGPSFAREVARGIPTRMILAGPRGPRAERLRKLFNRGALRVELSSDRKGVELGGSLKNVLAIGCGILDGLGAGANTKAALITQGMEEMGRLIAGNGGKASTIYGLAGLGDLIATGTSPESRNRAYGEKLGRGLRARNARALIPTVVEGIEASQSARALVRRARIKAPLLEAIWKVIHRGGRPGKVVEALGF